MNENVVSVSRTVTQFSCRNWLNIQNVKWNKCISSLRGKKINSFEFHVCSCRFSNRLLLFAEFLWVRFNYCYYLVEAVVQSQRVVSEQLLLLEAKQPFAECQASSGHCWCVVLHIELVGKLIGCQFPNWNKEKWRGEWWGVGLGWSAEGVCV